MKEEEAAAANDIWIQKQATSGFVE
jgi:hypothetical protein